MKKLLPITFILFSLQITAQENWFSGHIISNSQYYVDDSKTGDFDDKNRFRSNNYLKLDAIFNRFTFGLQLEGYAPQSILNFSPGFDKDVGIATYFASYNSDKLIIRAGYFYEQFGSGLILRSWEDKELGLNNALRGCTINYLPFPFLQMKGLYGKHRVGFDVSEGDIYGGDLEFNLSDALKIDHSNVTFGISYVSRSQTIEDAAPGFNAATNAFSGRLNFAKNNFYSNIEYVSKSKDALVEFGFIHTDKLFDGKALLLTTGYSRRGFGIDATFRRLENMSFYSNREVEGNIYNEQLVNYVPGLTKQHDYGLANIYVYQSQARLSYNPFGKAGEIGTQIDAFYTIKKGAALGGKYGTKLAINYAAWYGLDTNFDIVKRTYHSELLNFGKKYFSDFNVEIRKKWSGKWMSIVTFIDLFYSKKYVEETSGEVHAKTAIVESTYKYSNQKSVRVEAQHLWTKDDKKNWLAGTFELNLSSKFSLFASDMYNYGNDLKKIHYFNFGGSYSKNSTRLSFNYGRQRGGLLCVGGVCRLVPESTGIGLSLSTSF